MFLINASFAGAAGRGKKQYSFPPNICHICYCFQCSHLVIERQVTPFRR